MHWRGQLPSPSHRKRTSQRLSGLRARRILLRIGFLEAATRDVRRATSGDSKDQQRRMGSRVPGDSPNQTSWAMGIAVVVVGGKNIAWIEVIGAMGAEHPAIRTALKATSWHGPHSATPADPIDGSSAAKGAIVQTQNPGSARPTPSRGIQTAVLPIKGRASRSWTNAKTRMCGDQKRIASLSLKHESQSSLASGLSPATAASGRDFRDRPTARPMELRDCFTRRTIGVHLTDPKRPLLSPEDLNEKPRITCTRGSIAFWRRRLHVETTNRGSRPPPSTARPPLRLMLATA